VLAIVVQMPAEKGSVTVTMRVNKRRNRRHSHICTVPPTELALGHYLRKE